MYKFANRISDLKSSEVRQFLKLLEEKEEDIISFAGGSPAPELFPVEELKYISQLVLDEYGSKALQYSATEGFDPLRKQIAERMNLKNQTTVTKDDILITNGSQQGLDFVGKLFINDNDVILCESPTYIGAINAFKLYKPKFIEVPTDENGMIIEELERIIQTTDNIKMIYTVPDFQNPTGIVWSLERRQKFMEIATKYEIPVIEDSPYFELRYEGTVLPSLKSMDTKDLVIFLGTFSKIFCPGSRIGWIATSSEELLQKFTFIKQAADLQPPNLTQIELSKFIEIYDLDNHVDKIKDTYKRRKNLMIDMLKQEFPKNIKYTNPQGGLFLWVELPKEIKAADISTKAVEMGVSFIPGKSFFPNSGKENYMRLNFSNATEENIIKGMKILGNIINLITVQ